MLKLFSIRFLILVVLLHRSLAVPIPMDLKLILNPAPVEEKPKQSSQVPASQQHTVVPPVPHQVAHSDHRPSASDHLAGHPAPQHQVAHGHQAPQPQGLLDHQQHHNAAPPQNPPSRSAKNKCTYAGCDASFPKSDSLERHINLIHRNGYKRRLCFSFLSTND